MPKHYGHLGQDSPIMRECTDRPSDESAKALLDAMLIDDSMDHEFIRAYMKTALWVGSQFNCDKSSSDSEDNLANALVALCEFPRELRSGKFKTYEYSLTNLVVYSVRNKCLHAARNSYLVSVPDASARRNGITQPQAVKTVENGSYVSDDLHTCHLDRSYVTGHRLIIAKWQTINVETMLDQLPAPEHVNDTIEDDILNKADTYKQTQILRLLANGHSHREIAAQLSMSTRWVDKQVVALAANKKLEDALT